MSSRNHERVSNREDDRLAIESHPGAGEPAPLGSGRGLEIVDGFDESTLIGDGTESALAVLPDAWRATVDLPETGDEVVIGTDERVQITDTTRYPWRAICSLSIRAGNGMQYIGTGWLIGARTVITAGHCVYMHDAGGWARSIDVMPARNGASTPEGRITATDLRSVRGWTENRDRNYDYGCIILPEGTDLSHLGRFGAAAYSDNSLQGLYANLAGYPGDQPAGTMWFDAKRIETVTPNTIEYAIDTYGGQSGAPVWRVRQRWRVAVGIHTNGAQSGNSATRITSEVIGNMRAWLTDGG